MSQIDWIILISTLLFIVIYGTWKTKGSKDIHGYLLGGNEAKWWTIGLSVMATQASAITFLSTPGQAYSDGMRFVQFYFGLPIAMVIICVAFIPIYYKLKVYTAYEFLENRFDLKTRSLAAFLFLVQRGLAAGITIYAPAIILSSLLGWNLGITNVFIGVLVIIYTYSGGTKAVSQTQKQQMIIIMAGMFFTFYYLLHLLPENVGFPEAMQLADVSGKLNILDFSFDPDNRYTFWSGITGGLFLALSYFGTDQSQVQRYLGGKSVRDSRLGLIFNGIFKIPMQFFILLTGVLVFVFYQFNASPVLFNQPAIEKIANSEHSAVLQNIQKAHQDIHIKKKDNYMALLEAKGADNIAQVENLAANIAQLEIEQAQVKAELNQLIDSEFPELEKNDRDYVFLSFILGHLPKGLVGLLLAVILSAAMSSTSAELNALASTTTVDIYKRSIFSKGSDTHYLKASKYFTLFWGLVAILFATFGTLFENLIQLVNIIGSIFYGTILGIFIVAFFLKKVRGHAVFPAALIAQATVFILFYSSDLGYLWYNVIGCSVVVVVSLVLNAVPPANKKALT